MSVTQEDGNGNGHTCPAGPAVTADPQAARCWGYVCGEEDRRRGGVGRARAYFEHLRQKEGAGLQWSGVVEDEIPMTPAGILQRPGGQQLDGLIRRGDHVVVGRMEPQEVLSEFLLLIDQWAERGVAMHVADPRMDLRDPEHRAALEKVAAWWDAPSDDDDAG